MKNKLEQSNKIALFQSRKIRKKDEEMLTETDKKRKTH